MTFTLCPSIGKPWYRDGVRDPSTVAKPTSTITASSYGLVSTIWFRLSPTVKPSARYQVADVELAHGDTAVPAGSNARCSTIGAAAIDLDDGADDLSAQLGVEIDHRPVVRRDDEVLRDRGLLVVQQRHDGADLGTARVGHHELTTDSVFPCRRDTGTEPRLGEASGRRRDGHPFGPNGRKHRRHGGRCVA